MNPLKKQAFHGKFMSRENECKPLRLGEKLERHFRLFSCVDVKNALAQLSAISNIKEKKPCRILKIIIQTAIPCVQQMTQRKTLSNS